MFSGHECLFRFRHFSFNFQFPEEFEDTKEIIRIRIWKKNRQHNGQKKKYKMTNNDQQNIHFLLKLIPSINSLFLTILMCFHSVFALFIIGYSSFLRLSISDGQHNNFVNNHIVNNRNVLHILCLNCNDISLFGCPS
jgi:hypothetical protein